MDHFFYGEKPVTLNIEQLTEEAKEQESAIEVEFIPARRWDSWPYNEKLLPEDWVKPEWEPALPTNSWSHPDVLIFRNVPGQYTREQVKNFILNHAATETDEQADKRKRADSIISLITEQGSDAELLLLRNKLQSL